MATPLRCLARHTARQVGSSAHSGSPPGTCRSGITVPPYRSYKHFIKTGVKGSWSHIPALVHDEIDEASIHAIRMQIHLVGTRPWDPYSKAKYLHELRTQEHLPFATIVDFCGGRQTEVIEHINAYSDMEEYYRPIVGDDGSFDTTRFSGFIELQKPGLKQAITAAGFTLSDFARWIHDEKLYPLQKVRVLPRILRNDKAREIFIKQGARKAEAVLERPDLSKTLQEAELGQLARARLSMPAWPRATSRRRKARSDVVALRLKYPRDPRDQS